ncbi:MAG: DUF4962 domain-containing protein [Phycisphaera sp.]|nr:DUF4962 domain-containing protein [Phycisphaera sp.]
MIRRDIDLNPLRLAAAVVVATASLFSPAHAQTDDHADLPAPNWVTPRSFDKPAPHPRLYVSASQLQRAVKGRGKEYAQACDQIESAAQTGLREADNPMPDQNFMGRQILIVGRLSAMALQYHRTGDKRYIEASVKTIENMREWFEPVELWQLWHGGYATGIAINYDLLYNDMSPTQRKRVVDFAREYVIRPFLQRTGRGHNMREHGESGSWWQGIISNWNPVCNSGAGLLALAMYDDLDEAQTVVDRVNASFDPIIEYLQTTEGGWVEGLGYWNWTIHYMSLFYISYEHTTGTQHAGFRSPGFRKTLTFVSYFVPYDEACGFGDNQHGNISMSLFAAAEQIGDTEAQRTLQFYWRRYHKVQEQKQAIRDKRANRVGPKPEQSHDDKDKPFNIGYDTANFVLIFPDSIIDDKPAPTTKNLSYIYPKQGWGVLADKWPEPNIYVAYRAGQLGGAHTQDDLLTWHGVVGNEVMVKNIYSGHVSQNSFAGRRSELFETGSQSKNSLFVGGLGPTGNRNGPASARTTEYLLPTGPMALLEATRAMDTTRNRPRYVARAFLIVRDKGLLVLDRVVSPSGGGQPVEVRTYTPRQAAFGESDVLLKGDFQTARMTFASNVPSTLSRHTALMTFPTPDPPTMMRWQTNRSEASTVMASLLSSGPDPVGLSVEIEKVKSPDSDKMQDGPITVTMKSKDWQETIRLTDRLEPITAEEPAQENILQAD